MTPAKTNFKVHLCETWHDEKCLPNKEGVLMIAAM
jgi:hypothetical protein